MLVVEFLRELPMSMPRQALSNQNHNQMSRQAFITNHHHHHHHHLLHVLLFTLLVPISFAANDEVSALVSWMHSSSNTVPLAFSSWNPLDSNPCNWSYIKCSSASLVTEITIQNVELALPFPSKISSFPFLQKLVISGANLTGIISIDIGICLELVVLDLSSNSLVGGIPSSIGRLRNLQNLSLNSNHLTGQIPSEIGDCVNLKTLDIFDNNLNGDLPVELGKLSNLEVIRAGGNSGIAGNIPDELGDCKNLSVLGLADTKISGSLPASLGKLSMLQTLSIYSTMLSGEIPPEIGNCSELVNLFLYENGLSGSLPREIGKLQKLEKMLLWQNSFVGGIPEEIGNCRSLKILDVSLNSISGVIPQSLGKLSNLEELMLSNNNISGSIPKALSNLTNLIQLQLDTNQLSGSIPPELGSLTKLTMFFAWQNKLEGGIPSTLEGCRSLEALDLSYNALTDSLPPGLFKLQNLTKLLLISNDISGPIPPEIGKCSSLIRLRLVDNRISGEIPKEIGFLNSLNFLDLSENHLTGSVPLEIGNCKELQMLNLSNNSLSGALPSYLSSLTRLDVLDLSMNNFSGEVPMSIGQLTSLLRVILSKNSFSGPIPSSLGQCSGLQLLDLSSNKFSGTIPPELLQIEALDISLNFSHNALSGVVPPEISSLNKLSVLDLSHNNLEGDLMAFSGLENLVSLNISFNKFTGYLPDSKLFHQLSATDLAGNQGLCPNGHDSCFVSNAVMTKMINGTNSKRSEIIKLAIGLLSALVVAMAIFGAVKVFRARKMIQADKYSEVGGDSWPWQFTPFQKVNFSVEQVFKCLVESNVIGKGCSGIVYRAEMENGDIIAVKRLWPTTSAARYDSQSDKLAVNGGVRDSFSAEVKTLGSIRHKNIVRFLGCCWNRNTRLLMYDYMPNGSLGSLLHEQSGNCLEWDIRFRIILGAAQGVAYLHHDCAPPIVHRDIKANNILIGPEFEPYIADFGLAKLVDDGDFARSSSTLAGSYGYIAPEYGYMMKITEKSDVYSYGIVVLEVLTGKQPIDPTIPDGLHIVDWVRHKRGGVEVLDESLRARPESEIEEMLQTLGVALLCVNSSPDDRPTMKDVVAMMKEIRQEREECVKVDMLLNASSANEQQERNHLTEEPMSMISTSSTNLHLHYSPHRPQTPK
ncbi:LRR receptor-like serine/threonine-protein kinase RCH1 [Glycine soja]|uniref:non-specific serine/threonine protein kinase n=2 Tax=Glycine soja TaxID=3848 RepID=A0A445FU92_GLYSO|nr:LRR receptor-like serine/threonine-protein kinase RCH1 [Glycine soja]RZB52479.1 LRR receptor-like serine/threonine-protein kinase RCH1 [Glycine soja]